MMLINCSINSLVEHLVSTYKTNNPEELAEFMNIDVVYAPLSSINGTSVNISDELKIIIISEQYKNSEHSKFIIAHELYHAIIHYDLIEFYKFGINTKGKFERQANEFATKLLIYGKKEDYKTKYDLIKENYIPYEMERFV